MKFLKHVFCIFIYLKWCSPHIIQLNSTNWKQMLDGEWFVKFHAPWCPACRRFSPIWQQLSDDPSISTFMADVDVTESPVLSFIFFVKRLPTVYHVKNGLFRVYEGERTFDDLKVYLKSEKYETETPLPWYYSPASFHMHIFMRFMDLGIFITNAHQAFLDAGYSNWMSYLIIGLSTIFCGLFIGLVLVLIFDCFFPPRPQILRFIRRSKKVEQSLKESDKSKPVVREVDTSSGEDIDTEVTEIRQRKVDNNEVNDS
ncbi:Thioredoxin-related transmembrane protein isoform 1 [Schistosoma japonicum]|uniref:Thioredoxin-related transmembrane protein isoform 1 n=3 Tax=Schistosoma japonicum TaxID=6182 RepID=A0A4Z2DSJ1_SCHJA|nr:Thioredoxin-related transmembrane protein isoform 1 [Schistosoma japonicum]